LRHPGLPVLVLGVAFKRDIDDPRNSPAERVDRTAAGSAGAGAIITTRYVLRYTIGPDAFCPEGDDPEFRGAGRGSGAV